MIRVSDAVVRYPGAKVNALDGATTFGKAMRLDAKLRLEESGNNERYAATSN